ncbi:hypothetical protein F8388_004146, partial [Cannabis sativa]
CVTCLFPCVTFGRVGEIVDEGTNCKYKNYNHAVVLDVDIACYICSNFSERNFEPSMDYQLTLALI